MGRLNLKENKNRIRADPRFVARITIGANDDSKARFKYVKHSISNM